MAVTSATAYTHKEAYGQDYDYTGNCSYVSWHFQGSSSSASSTAYNTSGKVERYINVSVGSYYAANNVKLTSQSSEVTTTNSGTGVGIQRNRTNQYVYYKHTAIIKTDKENNLSIAEVDYRVYQTNN